MDSKPLDPAGHISLAVSDLSVSKIFYKNLFKCLGFQQIRESENSSAWVTIEGFGVWIKKAKSPQTSYDHLGIGLNHLCLKVTTKDLVDKVYELLNTEKSTIFQAPTVHPEFTPQYYNILFADPDGIKIEVAYY
jgi:catechol 2,3-dioxygenase-like lactoylglutathione lyase family enzyme